MDSSPFDPRTERDLVRTMGVLSLLTLGLAALGVGLALWVLARRLRHG
jgi:hypothetical protein